LENDCFLLFGSTKDNIGLRGYMYYGFNYKKGN
jgi:hypothetical protein